MGKRYWILILLFWTGLAWSGIQPHNSWHWIGEVSPCIIGFILLTLTFKRFRFSLFTYIIILVACWFIFIGAHYTFSRVPYITELTVWMGSERNNFDKAGHFLQGVVPILISRELFIRKKLVAKNWIGFLSFCVCLSTAATYEVIEFLVCIIAGKNIETFTGTQGYMWDSQTDILSALLGGLFILFLVRSFHDKQMKREFPSDFGT